MIWDDILFSNRRIVERRQESLGDSPWLPSSKRGSPTNFALIYSTKIETVHFVWGQCRWERARRGLGEWSSRRGRACRRPTRGPRTSPPAPQIRNPLKRNIITKNSEGETRLLGCRREEEAGIEAARVAANCEGSRSPRQRERAPPLFLLDIVTYRWMEQVQGRWTEKVTRMEENNLRFTWRLSSSPSPPSQPDLQFVEPPSPFAD